ncbi:MAG TPA: hypothetical protein VFN35_23395 [Ktedonobacteraceae bacterium]|nr:hypothetical protein [Ktedonobacteraceae bacterium]
MEESKPDEKADEEEQKRLVATIMPAAPEKEMPRAAAIHETQIIKDGTRPVADAELALMLKQIETYFGKQARNDDLEAMSFCLRHLFNRVDFLYCQALPDLDHPSRKEQGDYNQENLRRQRLWLQLQTINRTLDRMAPLCHLLSDVIECLLDTLDNEDIWLRTLDEEDTLQLEQIKAPRESTFRPKPAYRREQRQVAELFPSNRWERAVNTLMDQLLIWQEQHHKLVPFATQFTQPVPPECNLDDLDSAFAVLLDSAGAIFGDILPNFRLVQPEDKEEIGALLFDLMQQSDQMLVQFEGTVESLTRLIRHFALIGENG